MIVRRASLHAALSFVWLAVVGLAAWRRLDAERYLALGYDRLAALAVRDVVLDHLPFLVPGVFAGVAAIRLARRPRALAALVFVVPVAFWIASNADGLRATLAAAIPDRTLAAGVALGALLLVLFAGLGLSVLVGKLPALVRVFEDAARAIARLSAAVGSRRPARALFPWFAGIVPYAAALAAFVLPALRARAPVDAPSFVVVVIDTLRADHLGVYGYRRNTSPRIDAFASSPGSLVFDRAIAQASWTKPSIATMFTGLHPSVHRTGSGTNARRRIDGNEIASVPQPPAAPVTTGTLPARVVTIAERFLEAGYRTRAFVANALVSRRDGYAQGFERHETVDDRGISRGAARFLRDRAEERAGGGGARPFFLHLHYMAPHAPYDPPPLFDRFTKGKPTIDIHGAATKDSINFTGTLVLSESELAELVDQYDGEILFADAELGKVLAVLRESGLSEETYVVVTADHGEAFLEHGMVWHESTNLHDELVRVPLIVGRPAGGAAGDGAAGDGAAGRGAPARGAVGPRRVPDTVMHVDLAPTLLALAGLEPHAGLEGRSLVPLFRGEPLAARPAYAETLDWGVKQAVWARPMKMIIDREGGPAALFDLDEDPGEQRNLAATASPRGERAGVLADVRAALADSLNRRWRRNAAALARLELDVAPLGAEQRERLRSLGYVN